VILRRNRVRPIYSAAVEPPTLLQFVVLSMLLHVLLIVLFGNPTGAPRRGEGGLSPLDVTLRRLSPEPRSGFGLAPAEALRRLGPAAVEEADKPRAPSAVSPVKIERVAPPDRQRELAPPVELPPRVVPELPAAPIERTAPPRIERQLAAPAELPPRAVPAAPAIPLERVAPPALERELAPPAELPPRAVPAAPSAPLERVAPAQIEREMAPPVEVPPREAPLAPLAPIERIAPAQIERELAPSVEVPASREAPAEAVTLPVREAAPATAPSPRSVPVETAPRTERAAPPAISPSVPPSSPTEPLLRYGTPEAGEDIFKPRRDAGTPPGEASRIDLDAARKKAAREIVREGSGSRGVFTIPGPPPTEKKSKAAMAMEKALKPDCRTAYADMGLLAAPVLVASAISADGSCRW
jgi:hypothetical protein